MKNSLLKLFDKIVLVFSVAILITNFEPVIRTIISGRDYMTMKESNYHLNYLQVEFSEISSFEVENGRFRLGTLTNGKKVIIVNQKLGEELKAGCKIGAAFMEESQLVNTAIEKFKEAGIEVQGVEKYAVVIMDNPYRITPMSAAVSILGVVGIVYYVIRKVRKIVNKRKGK